jgi:hypothetical protein
VELQLGELAIWLLTLKIKKLPTKEFISTFAHIYFSTIRLSQKVQISDTGTTLVTSPEICSLVTSSLSHLKVVVNDG